jgi:hypothetical protein
LNAEKGRCRSYSKTLLESNETKPRTMIDINGDERFRIESMQFLSLSLFAFVHNRRVTTPVDRTTGKSIDLPFRSHLRSTEDMQTMRAVDGYPRCHQRITAM